MPENDFDVVTGASGYTGRYITRVLLSRGRRVKTLTGHPTRANPFGDQIEAVPFNFDRPDELKRSLEGARALFNTYWIRFPYGGQTFDTAVANTRVMLDAATAAGVRKFVHISVTNATESSPLPYFRGKAMVEAAIKRVGSQLRDHSAGADFRRRGHFAQQHRVAAEAIPVLRDSGRGDYRVQPIFAGDLGEIAVNAASDDQSAIFDAVGPEIFTFDELVRMIASAVHSKVADRARRSARRGRVRVDCRMVRARRYAHARRSSRPDEQSAGDGFTAERADALQRMAPAQRRQDRHRIRFGAGAAFPIVQSKPRAEFRRAADRD